MSISSRSIVLLAALLAGGGYWLWTAGAGSLAWAVPYLPFLVVLLCPLMHVFMHRKHGGENGESDVPRVSRPRPPGRRRDPS